MALPDSPFTGTHATQSAFNQMLANSQRSARFAQDFLYASAQTVTDISAKKFAFNTAVKSRIEGSSAYYKLIDEAIKKSGGAGG